jgi:nucleoside-diphosphate-sugar epimerase
LHKFIFIGYYSALSQYLCKHLTAAGNDIKFITNSASSNNSDGVFKFDEIDELISKLENKSRNYIVINIASMVPASCKNITDYFEVNCSKIPNVIDKLCDQLDVSHLLNISTIDIYSHSEVNINETTPEQPSTAYGGSKYWQERLLAEIAKSHGSRFLTVRAPLLIVPGGKNNFIYKWISYFSEGKTVKITNKDCLFNNFADARVIFEIVNKFIENIIMRKKINLAAKDTITILGLAKAIRKRISGSNSTITEVSASKGSQLISTDTMVNENLKLYQLLETIDWLLEEQDI